MDGYYVQTLQTESRIKDDDSFVIVQKITQNSGVQFKCSYTCEMHGRLQLA